MKSGQGGSSWRAAGWPGGGPGRRSGCAWGPQHMDQNLMADGGTAARGEGVSEQYVVGCPDVLELAVEGRPDLSGRRGIGADGRIDLGPLGRVRVEGRTTVMIGRSLAG